MDTTQSEEINVEEKVEVELSTSEKLLIEQVMRDIMSDVFASGSDEENEAVN